MVGRYSHAGGSANHRTLYQWAGALGIAALIVLGTHSPIFTLAALGITAMQFVFADEDYSWKLIFFLFSFAKIFKLSPTGTSLFTYLILLLDVVLLMKRRTLSPLWILFAIYTVAVPFLAMEFSSFSILRWIKLLCSLQMMLYYFDQKERTDEALFLFFIAGVLLASLTYYLDSGFFRITRYVEDEVGVYYTGMSEADRNRVRFAGLYSDPNYYAVNVIISMCLSVILLHRGKISLPVFALLMAVFLYFVKSTYSKSALLMTILPICMFLYVNKIEKRRMLQAVSIAAVVASAVYLLHTGGGEAFSIVMGRLHSAKGDLNSLTTGRFNIWMYNLEFFKSHPWSFLFGKGIGARLLNGRAHHNAYLEILWHLGLVGGGMLLGLLMQIFRIAPRRSRRNPLNYSVLCCIVVMYFFLSVLFYFDPPYHIIIAFIVLNMDLK